MSTFKIISSQLSFFNTNLKEYFYILLPVIIISLIPVFIPLSFYYNATINNLFVPIVVIYYLLSIYFTIRAIVNIHRLVILGENSNYHKLNKKIKDILKYSWVGFLMALIAFIPLLLSVVLPIIIDQPWFFLLTLIALAWFFLVYPFIGLNLPMAAIGKKVQGFKMFKMSKGFRLTLFLQSLILGITYWIIHVLLTALWAYLYWRGSFLVDLVMAINILFQTYFVAISISCLSKTYILWEESFN